MYLSNPRVQECNIAPIINFNFERECGDLISTKDYTVIGKSKKRKTQYREREDYEGSNRIYLIIRSANANSQSGTNDATEIWSNNQRHI